MKTGCSGLAEHKARAGGSERSAGILRVVQCGP